jgi:CheY-like chemotaxis protein/HPt (histidine-containing phosphotransfer) domain-containing protein
MTAIRLLHVDDEPDIRTVVELALSMDPIFEIRSCESGADALAAAAEWQPDVMLLDVMMPVMDGPATLAQLRANPATTAIPVIFMTARAQARETERFRSLGAIGVIPKPFDPMTLAASVRNHVTPPDDPLVDLRAAFLLRLKRDVEALAQDRPALQPGQRLPATLDRIKRITHSLAGAAGVYGFDAVSDRAAALEEAIVIELAETGPASETDRALDGLLIEARKVLPHG